jgi:ADP-ribose pyrophosphatase YjhB (NUDIX family)
VTDGPRSLHRGEFLELLDRDGWVYAHRFATLGIVMVVAVDRGALLLVEQFRYAQNAAVLTLPGGLVDAQDAVDGGDPFADAAARELIEVHELSNVLMTPHSSSSSEATADRRWSAVAANLDCFARGEPLQNVVFQT